MRLDVAGLRRIGRLAALDLRLINRSPYGGDAFSIDDTFSREGYDDLDGVLVIDRHSGRELATVSDPEADTTMIDIASGGSQQLRVAFPAPSGNAVDVLVPHFGLFRNVPVH